MSPHVLIVGALPSAHRKFKELGGQLSLFIPMDRLSLIPTFDIYERMHGFAPTASIEEWIEQARLLHEIDPVEVIAGFHESTEEHAAAIAAALDLPFHSRETVARTHNKALMRETLRRAGVDPTGSRCVSSAAEIEAFAAEYGYPLILKPVDGRGSTGVSTIRRPEELAPAIEWFRQWAPTADMYVEQFLHGVEVSVESFSEQGRHHIVCITQKYKETTHFVEIGHCLPAETDAATTEAIHELVTRMLTALGVQYGPSHTEVMITPDGPRVVETHTRMSGGYLTELIESVSGVNLLDLWVRQVLGEQVGSRLPVTLQPSGNRFAATWYMTPEAIGTIERVDGLDQAKAIDGIMQVGVLQGPGTTITGAHDSFSRAAYATATGSSHGEAVTRAQEATQQLRFLIACQG